MRELSAGSLAGLEFPARPTTFIQEDVAAAFRHVGIPTSLGCFFCSCARVRAGDVEVQEIDGQLVETSAWFTPLLNVLPMGWSCVFFIQAALRAAGRRSGLDDDDAVGDRRASKTQKTTTACMYVDNFLCFRVEQLFQGHGQGCAQTGESVTFRGVAHGSRSGRLQFDFPVNCLQIGPSWWPT